MVGVLQKRAFRRIIVINIAVLFVSMRVCVAFIMQNSDCDSFAEDMPHLAWLDWCTSEVWNLGYMAVEMAALTAALLAAQVWRKPRVAYRKLCDTCEAGVQKCPDEGSSDLLVVVRS
jgi:hypothetical protein